MLKFRSLVAVVPMLALAAGLGATPVSAAGVGDGTLVFRGEADLPAFPCPAGCPADFNAVGVASHLSGVDAGTAWEVNTTGGTVVSKGLTYTEPQATCPAQGIANGVATADAGVQVDPFAAPGGAVIGRYGNRPVAGIHTSTNFSWTRVGLTAILTNSGVTVDLIDSSNTLIATVIANGTGGGVAAFTPWAPLQGVGNFHANQCQVGGPLNISVVGMFQLA